MISLIEALYDVILLYYYFWVLQLVPKGAKSVWILNPDADLLN